MNVKNTAEPYDREKLYPEPRYKGIRKRYAGKVIGLGEDWIFYIQYRDRTTNKVILKRIGKLSEGWTAKKAVIMRDKAMLASQNLDQQNQSSNNIQAQSETVFSDLLIATSIDPDNVTLFDIWQTIFL